MSKYIDEWDHGQRKLTSVDSLLYFLVQFSLFVTVGPLITYSTYTGVGITPAKSEAIAFYETVGSLQKDRRKAS